MIKLRPVEEKDKLFLEKVYRSTREEELKITGWPEVQKEAFIHMQSVAQHTDYKAKFPGAAFCVVVFDKKDAGRFYTWEGEQEIRVLDISLLPSFRGKGIGSFLLTELIKRADAVQKKISLHVEASNPALRLYRKLGFIQMGTQGWRLYMERNPG